MEKPLEIFHVSDTTVQLIFMCHQLSVKATAEASCPNDGDFMYETWVCVVAEYTPDGVLGKR